MRPLLRTATLVTAMALGCTPWTASERDKECPQRCPEGMKCDPRSRRCVPDEPKPQPASYRVPARPRPGHLSP